MKGKISPAKVILAGAAWRTLGSRRAAGTLIEALSGDDEQNRMLAGMSLVKAGARSVELIERKVASGEAPPALVRLLPDLDQPRSRELLRKIAIEESGELADAARQCLAQLDRIDALSGKGG